MLDVFWVSPYSGMDDLIVEPIVAAAILAYRCISMESMKIVNLLNFFLGEHIDQIIVSYDAMIRPDLHTF